MSASDGIPDMLVNPEPLPTKLVAVTIPAVTLPLANIVAAVPTLVCPDRVIAQSAKVIRSVSLV